MLHARVSNTTIGIVRVAVFGMWLKHLAGDPIARFVRTPFEFFTRIGPLAWLPADWWSWIYQPGFMQAARIVLLLAIGACLLGLRPYRLIAIATCVGLTLYQSFVRGYGYLHHGELPMLFAAYVLAVYPAARGFALSRDALRPDPAGDREDTDTNRAAMLTICLAFCLTYAFVGTRRVLDGGIEVYFDHTILHYIARYTFGHSLESPGLGRLVLEIPLLGKLVAVGYATTTFFELLSPLAIFWRRFRWLWIAVILVFHIASGLLMHIWFTANIPLILLCMTELEATLARVNAGVVRIGLPQLSFLPAPPAPP
jgi:hypothetical protein